MSENTNLQNSSVPEYQYIIESDTSTVVLTVDEGDIIYNADEEIDCPLDVVLRKNNLTFDDLMKQGSRRAQLIKIHNQTKTVVNSISLDVNL